MVVLQVLPLIPQESLILNFYFNREQIIALSFLFVFFILGLLLQEISPKPLPTPPKKLNQSLQNSQLKPQNPQKTSQILVHLKGAVLQPGKYFVPHHMTFQQLIKLSGGFSQTADLSKILTHPLFKSTLKHQQIYFVPSKKLNQKLQKIIEVEIRGAVSKPGVYQLHSGSRLNHLIDLAHGFLPSAKNKPLKNYFLKDGQSFFIPYQN